MHAFCFLIYLSVCEKGIPFFLLDGIITALAVDANTGSVCVGGEGYLVCVEENGQVRKIFEEEGTIKGIAVDPVDR